MNIKWFISAKVSILIYFILYSHINPGPSSVMVTELTPNLNNSQAPASEADTSYSQGSTNVVIYEDVAEKIPHTIADHKYTLNKCPAYESHQPVPKVCGQRITPT